MVPRKLSISLFVLLASFALWVNPAMAGWRAAIQDEPVQVLQQKVDYTFGGQVTFWAQFKSESPIIEVDVFYHSQNQTNTLIGQAVLNLDQATYVHDLTNQALEAFSQVEYWFNVKLQNGQVYHSPAYSFYYEDNRYRWQQLESGPFVVHWYDGDLIFGQGILDVAKGGLEKAQKLLDLPTPEKVNLYIYASGAEMRATLNLAGIPMVGGHASPEQDVIVIALPPGPGQNMESERQVPHELMHILLYQKLGTGYENLPTWLSEGLSSLNELYPNPDYYVLLKNAMDRETFIPLSSLCYGFPLDAASFYLSYAQSESFIRYLYRNNGKSDMEALLYRYADGLDCERAPLEVYGQSLSQLETTWRKDLLGDQAGSKVAAQLMPWFVLLAAIMLVPILLSIENLVKSVAAEKQTRNPKTSSGG